MSSRMAWRTAGNVGRGGGPLILFFPPCGFEPAILEESVGDHRHERVTMQSVPGSTLEVIETEFFFQLLAPIDLRQGDLRLGPRRSIVGRYTRSLRPSLIARPTLG